MKKFLVYLFPAMLALVSFSCTATEGGGDIGAYDAVDTILGDGVNLDGYDNDITSDNVPCDICDTNESDSLPYDEINADTEVWNEEQCEPTWGAELCPPSEPYLWLHMSNWVCADGYPCMDDPGPYELELLTWHAGTADKGIELDYLYSFEGFVKQMPDGKFHYKALPPNEGCEGDFGEDKASLLLVCSGCNNDTPPLCWDGEYLFELATEE